MGNYNRVILLGRLTRDPEVKTVGETQIAEFGLAVEDRKENVNFFDVEAFNKQAELIGQYFKKGREIFLEGRLKQDKWEDKESGQKRSKVVIVVDNFAFTGNAKSDGDGAEKANEKPQEKPQQQNRRRPF